jgi:uncharacterized protein (TIGR02186 family)
MRYRSRVKLAVSSPLLLVVVQCALCSDAFAALTAKANHDHITIDFGYHGSTVTVRGEADEGVDLVVKITSPDGRQTMNKKGKVGGFLWMNVGSLSFERAPNLYEVFSTRKLDDILIADERVRHVIGYEALETHVEVKPAASEQENARWFREFVNFKESSNLYAVSWGRIETKNLANGRQEYLLATNWPHQAPPGEYTVTVFAVKDGKICEQAECKVHVEQIGLVKSLASMARDSAVFYAVLSIGVALSAGFGVGMILRKGGGSH